MKNKVYVFDPTTSDKQSAVRGVGRYLQILKENFPDWTFTNQPFTSHQQPVTIFINPFFNFLLKPLTIHRLAKKQIAVIHDLIPLKYPSHFPAGIRGNINIFLNKLALKNYDLIITDSQASKKDIVDILKISEEKIKVIYPCLPQSLLKLKIKNSKRLEFSASNLFGSWNLELGTYCLYVGDVTWNKNLVNLAKAIKIINVPCIFVGKMFNPLTRQHVNSLTNKWQLEYKKFLNEVKDDKRFIFAGFVNDDQLVKLYQQAKVNILVSRAEGFGFSYLEAANFGCLSILSDIPVFHEISDNQGAIFANPNDPNDIADKIGEVYFHDKLRSKLSFEAQQQAKHFSREKFKKEFLKLIENLI